MGTDSDYGELLAAYSALQKKQRFTTIRAIVLLASAFAGSGWVANAYLGRLATKDDVAALIAGQQAQLKDINDKLAMLNVRMSVAEDRLSGMRVKP